MQQDQRGYEFIAFLRGAEDQLLQDHTPVTAAMVVAMWNGSVVMGFNRHRCTWEAPAGSIEQGETMRECAAREFQEESCQCAAHLDFAGLAHLRRPDRQTKYTAVYTAVLSALQPFRANVEWQALTLWDWRSRLDVEPSDAEILRRVRPPALELATVSA